jgi:hypothetical protein
LGIYCVYLNVKGKKMPVETLSQIGENGVKEYSGGAEFKYDIFDVRTFVNTTMYP